MRSLHQRLELYTERDAYHFIPTDPSGGQTLTIYRTSSEIELNTEYIIVLTGREKQGVLMGQEVYRATEFDILPLNPNISAQHPPHAVEGHLLALIRSHLKSSFLLLSYGWDLTTRLQAQWAAQDRAKGKALWETTTDSFGTTFDIRPSFLNGHHIKICLISRRSRYRAGTRYFRRGIDHEGHVANFNETEQLLFIGRSTGKRAFDDFHTKMSFVQIRGSIPVYWGEVNTLRYKPDLQVMDLQDTADAMRMHLQEQVSLYGEQTLVNLVNHKGYEQPVKAAYEKYVAEANLAKVKYEYFDFHTECRKMRWDRISVLIDAIQDDLVHQGYFHLESNDAAPTKLQQGTIRTNCMDNLDRTNVVQAALAKWTINRQLKSLGIFSKNESIDDHEDTSKDFREVWADHADLISKAYAGSGALKTDFTRTNKRTRKGLLEDGYKSILRYLKNNYFDGARQDAFDLVTGTWTPRMGVVTATGLVSDHRPLFVPYVTSVSLFMICAGLTLPRSSGQDIMLIWSANFLLMQSSRLFTPILFHALDIIRRGIPCFYHHPWY
ncbi:hypothetical protein HWV62_44443 [Athelia sp. TMB]|nr:hypothetical protein HWV62_44443 [Athelia sp. TMB]